MPPIGKNASCPCGSGKKFKKCCLPLVAQWPIYNERLVLTPLLDHSKHFSEYYMACRPQIKSTVFWAMDTNLPSNEGYSMVRLTDDKVVIRLYHIPPSPNEDLPIAHELQHVIVCEEGFPGTKSIGLSSQVLSTALNNALHHPLVNRRLKTFDFDIEADLLDEAKTSRNMLTGLCGSPLPEPGDSLQRSLWIMKLVGFMLSYKEVSCAQGPSEFETWFAALYPSIASEARRLFSMICRTGYDTPCQCRKALSALIRELHLEDVVQLVSQPSDHLAP